VPILPVFGHDALRSRLDTAISRGTLPASLLLTGQAGVGKQRLALWLGQRLLCTGPETAARPCGVCQSCRYALECAHPDLHWIFPRPPLKEADADARKVRADYADAIRERVDNLGIYAATTGAESIFVATVRAVVQSAVMSPALGKRKVFVIGDAERMVPQEGSEQAANAFLKLLEEPPADTTIVLTTSEPGALLPTIRSRVVGVRVPPVADRDVERFVTDPLVAGRLRAEGVEGATKELVRIAGGAPGRLFSGASASAALASARRLLDAATAADRSQRYRVALAQGVSGARGKFTETLEALTVLLHERARQAVDTGSHGAAVGASRAIEAVERAKEMAHGNVSPQLIGMQLIRELGAELV
jgi:DNA polymerase III subunit delta'